MAKWFYRLEDRNKKKIFKYIEELDKRDCDDGQMVEAMMKKTEYNREFCTECIEAWSQTQKVLTQQGYEQEGSLF